MPFPGLSVGGNLDVESILQNNVAFSAIKRLSYRFHDPMLSGFCLLVGYMVWVHGFQHDNPYPYP